MVATKLKKMHLTSVDLVRAGANPKADICLYKSADYDERQREDDLSMVKIDKSLFDEHELAIYNELIAKASVDPDEYEEEMEKEKPAFPIKAKRTPLFEDDDFDDDEEYYEEARTKKNCKTKKSANEGVDLALEMALERLEQLEKSAAMKEFTEVAKKYAPLGENEEELAKTLYEMHKASPDNYDAYIKVLDKSLGIVEKSGLFAEVGKSAHGAAGGDTVDKVNAIAKSLLEADPSLTHEQAIAKAWENNPDLIMKYEAEYSRQ